MTLARKYWLWVAAMACVLLCSFLSVIIGAQGPAMVQAPELAIFEALPVYGTTGKLTSFHVTAKFRVTELQPGGAQETRVTAVEFDLVRQGAQTVSLDGQLARYRDIADDLIGIALHNWRIAHPGPLPLNGDEPVVQRRRATRAEKN